MTPPSPRRRWLVPLAGFAAVALFLTLIARFWHPVYGFTSLIQLDGASDDVKISAFRERPIFVYPGSAGYDGIYYAELAYDPSLRNPEFVRAMDNFSYRARRILPSALAWLLAAGQPAWIVHVYSLLNVAAWLALAVLLWRLLAVEDARGWLAWAGVLFSAGAIASVRLSLTDLVALTILAGALLAAERGKNSCAVGTLAAAALARETSLIGFIGFVRRPWISWKNVFRGLAVLAPLALWLAYVRLRTGPADQGWSNFTLPVAGLIEKWHDSLVALGTVGDKPLAWTTLLAVLGLTVQAAFFLSRWRPDDRWWRIGAVYAVMLLCLGTAVWEGFPGAATRVLLPLTLAFNVVIARTRAPLAWLIAGNLAVFSGLLALRDVPSDPRELAAARIGETACIARIGDGWFGREHDESHTWYWCSQRGTLTLEAWPKTERTLLLDFKLRAIKPCTVIVRQNGNELARFDAGTGLSFHFIHPLRIVGGQTTLEFSTATPPTRESANPDARTLAFALYDARLGVKRL